LKAGPGELIADSRFALVATGRRGAQDGNVHSMPMQRQAVLRISNAQWVPLPINGVSINCGANQSKWIWWSAMNSANELVEKTQNAAQTLSTSAP
jgi:hypothetical protein